MSTGADCRFWYEEGEGAELRGWRYKIQLYPYGESTAYTRYGPFERYWDADQHLANNHLHGNPGSRIIESRPKNCPHEGLRSSGRRGVLNCLRCGLDIDQRDPQEIARERKRQDIHQVLNREWAEGVRYCLSVFESIATNPAIKIPVESMLDEGLDLEKLRSLLLRAGSMVQCQDCENRPYIDNAYLLDGLWRCEVCALVVRGKMETTKEV